MKTIRGMCTLALVTTCLQGSPATAQTVADPNPTKAVEQIQTLQLESLLGREVRTRSEGDSGRIIDLLTDRDGKLQAAVVEMGGFLGIGTRKIAIDWRSFNFTTPDPRSFVTLEVSREQLRLAPEYTARETVVVLKAKD
jgi:hypothetical protein